MKKPNFSPKMLPIALIYTPDFGIHDPGQIKVERNNLYHLVAGQKLLDPIYTLNKIEAYVAKLNAVHHGSWNFSR